MKKGFKVILIIGIILLFVSFINDYVGHFSFEKPVKDGEVTAGEPEGPPPVRHISLEMFINNNIQKVNILEIDLSCPKVSVKPVLAYDSVFGFELLSSIIERREAYAGVNAGFFYEYGQPGGMVVIDGRIITGSTGRYPVFVIAEGKGKLVEMDTQIWLEGTEDGVKADWINRPGAAGKCVIYTPEYGSNNRAEIPGTSAVIKNGTVEKIVESHAGTSIPTDGALITFFSPSSYEKNIPFKTGDKVQLEYEPFQGEGAQAYECGSWIVKDGENVAPDKDPWVGVLTNRDPRTVVGLKDSKTVVLITIDGRQKGYSTGVTGKELGDYLLSLGIKDAAMLDGGASTEMIVQGNIVNRPSFKGNERLLGGALIVNYTE